MSKGFNFGKWIWISKDAKADEYGDFKASFYVKKGEATCKISCDGDYALFINGEFVESNQYGDYEHYKVYDSVDISKYLISGENEIKVLVWHTGEDFQRCIKCSAGLIFEIEQDGKILAKSDQTVLCRQNSAYENGYCKEITPQIGYSFLYDANKEDLGEYIPATLVDKKCEFYPRPIKKLQLLNRKGVTVLRADDKGCLVDLGEETVGLPTFEFISQAKQKVLFTWGEDLDGDGHPRRIIGSRDFSFEYIAKSGYNSYTNYMLRLGCRYIEMHTESPVEVKYLGLIPQVYPVEERKFTAENQLDQRIYDLCLRTLKLCMMEHYVDTPWREQCLYAYDSRNQILCGYRAFIGGNAEYARANLLLMSKDRREDNLLAICYPCGSDLTIPSFSLHYFTAIKEYIENTGDISLGVEVYDKLISVIKVFVDNIKDGLVYTFEGTNHWNFYDWSDYLGGDTLYKDIPSHPDLMINCLFITALENLRYISQKIGKPFGFDGVMEEVRLNTRKTFFDKEKRAYSLTQGGKEFNALCNALAILSGVAENKEEICKMMANGEFVDCTLSFKCFEYDAMLFTDKEEWESFVIDDIRRNYKVMLDGGATSVWETMDGFRAFDQAGSLCHGWSAVPICYLKGKVK